MVATMPSSCSAANVTMMKYMPRVRRVTRLSTAAATAQTSPPTRQPRNGDTLSLAARIPVAYAPRPTKALLPSEMYPA